LPGAQTQVSVVFGKVSVNLHDCDRCLLGGRFRTTPTVEFGAWGKGPARAATFPRAPSERQGCTRRLLHRGGGRSRVIHVEMRASGRAENPSRQGFIQPAGFVRRNAQEVPGLQGLLSRLWRLLGRPFCPFLACRRTEAGGLGDGPAFAPFRDGARTAWRGTWALLAGLDADLGHQGEIGLALAVATLAGIGAAARPRALELLLAAGAGS